MTSILFEHVTLQYPIYNAGNMSLRNKLVHVGTGGLIAKERTRRVVVTALNDVSFHLKEGDAVGLIGHNGAGKTTLLRAIAGIYEPAKGRIVRSGSMSTLLELGAGLEAELNGYDNILRMGQLHGLSLKEAKAMIPDIEDFTELGNFLAMPVRTYSAGMMMRLMFAIATSRTPEILLIDEVIGVGDKNFNEKASKRLERLIKSAHILVFASHGEELIKNNCNRIFKLAHGKIEELNKI